MDNISTRIVRVNELTTAETAAWTHFTENNPILYSPYFKIGYAQILSSLCKDVRVLAIYRDGDILAFLPFQAKLHVGGKVGFARPAGAPMTDYHGFICAPGTNFDAFEVLKQAEFGAYHFSALVDNCDLLSSHTHTPRPCTVMDISQGAQHWRDSQNRSYRRHLKNYRRQVRKTDEYGPRRFEYDTGKQEIFDQLMQWKQAQFIRSGKYDVLSADWTKSLLHILWKRGPSEPFRADLHAFFIGDELAAVDLGLTDGITFHSWIIAYNSKFHKVAPGIQLLEGLIDASGALGYKRIDLGEGVDGYKHYYASEDMEVNSGFIAARGSAAALSKIYGSVENFSENNLGKVGGLPGKVRRRYSQISACDASLTGRSIAMLQAVKGK